MTHSYQGFTVKTSHCQTGCPTETAQAVEQPVGQPVECLYTLNVYIHDTAGCPTGCQTGADLTRDVLTMHGRFDWGRYNFGTFRRRDVLTMGHFDSKAIQLCFRCH